MTPEVCIACGREIAEGQWAIDLEDDKARHEDCGTLTIGSVFSGIGGLELGLESCGLGPVRWQAECDPHALAVLAQHWPTTHRYTDVRDVNESATRVDVVCGGFPCQPHSLAGRRRGTADSRWLWPEFARIIGQIKPAAVFIENVPGLRTSGLSIVLADLASLGFDAEWGCFSAAEVGAPHLRRRLFILAYANGEQRGLQPGRRSRENGTDPAVIAHDGSDGPVAKANGQGELQPRGAIGTERGRPSDGGESMADATGLRARESADKANAESGGRDTRTQPRGRGWWATEPDVGRVVTRLPSRMDRRRRTGRAARLKCLGNAVVPQQAALAWRELVGRFPL